MLQAEAIFFFTVPASWKFYQQLVVICNSYKFCYHKLFLFHIGFCLPQGRHKLAAFDEGKGKGKEKNNLFQGRIFIVRSSSCILNILPKFLNVWFAIREIFFTLHVSFPYSVPLRDCFTFDPLSVLCESYPDQTSFYYWLNLSNASSQRKNFVTIIQLLFIL